MRLIRKQESCPPLVFLLPPSSPVKRRTFPRRAEATAGPEERPAIKPASSLYLSRVIPLADPAQEMQKGTNLSIYPPRSICLAVSLCLSIYRGACSCITQVEKEKEGHTLRKFSLSVQIDLSSFNCTDRHPALPFLQPYTR